MLTALIFAQAATSFRIESLDLRQIVQGWGSARANRSVDNNPLRIAGWQYEHGLGTHARSEFRIRLHRGATAFTAGVGLDDEAPRGTVTFQVWVDNQKRWDSGLMKGKDQVKRLNVPLSNAQELRLVVTDGGDDIDYDHADWVDGTITLKPGARPPLALRTEIKVEPPIPIAYGDPLRPMIHGPRVIGTTPGRPFLFKIPATGLGAARAARGGRFTVVGKQLPQGLTLDGNSGIISGSIAKAGTYKFTAKAYGAKGSDTREYTIVAGAHKLAMTPPMGWNSWNIWGTAVDAKKVRDSADAFVKAGLADYGYQYVNIDDAWEGTRDASGKIQTNQKFGDMKALADYVHSKGLKLGIYSSPGPKTCANYEGSYQHELDDAQSYAAWGIDYLKYDWCSYGGIAPRPDLPAMQKPYITMRTALDQVNRDIVYSLCQYGMGDVYKWGAEVGGDVWRTTGDITDTWSSMSNIGFIHSPKAVGVAPGGWNDPDMLVVGHLGWGPNPRPTRLTPNEQITHITLWSLLAAPLIIGCDLTKLDPFTKALLCNHDVIEVDQDPLGKAATQKVVNGTLEVWSRPLWDGSIAVGFFNRGTEKATVTATWKQLGITGPKLVRDLWVMKNIGTRNGTVSAAVPAHGAMLYKIGGPRGR